MVNNPNENFERAKELLYQIFDITSGGSPIPENKDWAQENLGQVFEMLPVCDLAEDLQHVIYEHTFARDKAYNSWLEQLSGTKQKESETAKDRITETARKLAIVLASQTVELPLKQAIDAILFEAANESDTHITDAKIIETSFPVIMENLELEYSRGIFHSLESILEHAVSESEFETSNEVKSSHLPKILDLSDHPENLDINSEKELAELLSKVMTHPNLSDELQMIIGNGITDTGGESKSLNEFNNSPKVIYEYLFGGE